MNKYIALKENIRFHKTPGYCMLIDLIQGRVSYFNKESIKLLNNCTGEKRILDIVDEYYSEEWRKDKDTLLNI